MKRETLLMRRIRCGPSKREVKAVKVKEEEEEEEENATIVV